MIAFIDQLGASKDPTSPIYTMREVLVAASNFTAESLAKELELLANFDHVTRNELLAQTTEAADSIKGEETKLEVALESTNGEITENNIDILNSIRAIVEPIAAVINE